MSNNNRVGKSKDFWDIITNVIIYGQTPKIGGGAAVCAISMALFAETSIINIEWAWFFQVLICLPFILGIFLFCWGTVKVMFD
jgi:hypothetical protein